MRTSQRLRHCALVTQLGVNAVLGGCAVAQPMPSGPVVIYDDAYWDARSCEGVEEPVIKNCNAAHARAGLSQAATIPELTPSLEEAMQALDVMLAQSLKDPMSAMQYRVSGLEHCQNIVLSNIVEQKERGCLCYTVNAKNSYGGYTGGQFGVVRILQIGKGNSFTAQTVDKSLFLSAVWACHTEPRDAEAIKADVR